MKYRKLGRSGLKVSEISLGSWLTYGGSTDKKTAIEVIDQAYELGINFFDTANVYAHGKAEEIVGEALSKYPRESYVLASKVWGPMGEGPNDKGLSRKHITEQADASLKRLGHDYMDIYYCHRFDPDTDLHETLRAFDDLVTRGKILYMGVSNWTALEISSALAIADRYLLDRMIVSQPIYNMFSRQIEGELLPFCEANGISQAVYSPLAQGVLTEKYLPGKEAPQDSRAKDPDSSAFIARFIQEDRLIKAEKLRLIADSLDIRLSNLALAWILRQKGVASAIVGASRREQIIENSNASGIKLDDETLMDIEAILEE